MMANKSDHKSDLEIWQPLQDQSKDKIISWLYSRNDLHTILKKVARTSYLTEELTSELFLWLCKKEDEEIIDLYSREVIDFVILCWIRTQWHSTESTFYRKIRKYEIGKAMTEEQKAKVIEILYSGSDQDVYEIKDMYRTAFDNALNNLESPGEYKQYHKEIIEKLLKYKTIKGIQESMTKKRIRHEYISEAISDAKLMLKEMIEKEIKEILNTK